MYKIIIFINIEVLPAVITATCLPWGSVQVTMMTSRVMVTFASVTEDIAARIVDAAAAAAPAAEITTTYVGAIPGGEL